MPSTCRDQILIWGTGGHAKVVAEIITRQNEYEIAGFIDDRFAPESPDTFLGHQIIGSREALPRLREKGLQQIAIAIGNCQARIQAFEYAKKTEWSLPVLTHPQSIIASDVSIDAGTIICAGAIIGPSTKIGSGCIINTAASVDHDCCIEQGVHICPGTHLAGHVSIGRQSWIGIGSTVIEQIKIGEQVFLGAGSVVTKDLPANCKAWGVPATIQK